MVIINLIIIGIILFLGYRRSRNSPLLKFYWPGVSIKIVAGIIVGLVYTYYYDTGDSFAMFSEAIKLKQSAFASINSFVNIYLRSDYSSVLNFSYVYQPRAAFMSKVLALGALSTNDNYWITGVYLSIFSFAGFWKLANVINRQLENRWKAVIPTLFFPSIVFWTSGVLKESVAIGALAGVMALLATIYFSNKLTMKQVGMIIIGLFLIASLKYYYAAVLIVSSLSLFTTRLILGRSSIWWKELGLMITLFTIFLSIASLSHINFWPSRFLAVIVDNYNQFQLRSEADNLIRFYNLEPSIFSFMLNSPKALFAGLFFPIWLNSFSPVKLLSLLESWSVVVLFFFAIKNFQLPQNGQVRIMIFSLAMFIVLAAVFIAFSTPNIGSLVRIRVGYQLVFLTLVYSSIRMPLKSN